MATGPGAAVLRLIRKLGEKHSAERASDRDLLRRFVERSDQEAFTALVRRHGPLVMGVGLRLLRHYQDAEDVFQATFLLLARKANATAWRESVANWLYGVAYHLALKARDAAARRKAHESKSQPKPPPDPLADLSARDLQHVLDEELNRLAEKYRAPLLLCCLEGKTRDEAARLLGVPLATVIGRLEAGRERLRRRLARRGVPLSLAFAGGTLLAPTARAAVHATVARAASQAALRTVAGEGLTEVVSRKVAILVNGGAQAMFLTRLKVVAACGLAFTLACLAAWAVLPRGSAQEPPKHPPILLALGEKAAGERKPQPAAKPAGPGTLLLARRGDLVALTPEGKEGAKLTGPAGSKSSFQGRLSPDGTRAAYIVTAGRGLRPPARVGEEPEPWPFQVVVRKLGAAEPSAVVDLPAHHLTLAWAPDGKRLLASKATGTLVDLTFETVLIDPKTGKTEALDLPAGVSVLDCARDGKTFLVMHRHDKKYRLGLAAKGDREVRVLTEFKGKTQWPVGRFSPDGTRVLYTDADPADKDAGKWGLSSKPYLLDVATRKRALLAEFPMNAQALGVAWSPDGKRVAYTWKQLHPEILKKDSLGINDMMTQTEAFLIVADLNGKNARTVTSARSESAINAIFGSIDWR